MKYQKTLLAISLSACLAFTAGCGTLTGIPSHGGGKRFATEQKLVSASIRASLKNIDVSALRGHKVAIVFNLISDQGGGNLSGGRLSLTGMLNMGTMVSPVTATMNQFQVFDLVNTNTNYNNAQTTGTGQTVGSSTIQSTDVTDSSGNSITNSSQNGTSNTNSAGTNSSSGSSTNQGSSTSSGTNSSSSTGNQTTNGTNQSNGTNSSETNGSSSGTSSSTNNGTQTTNGSNTGSSTNGTTGTNSNTGSSTSNAEVITSTGDTTTNQNSTGSGTNTNNGNSSSTGSGTSSGSNNSTTTINGGTTGANNGTNSSNSTGTNSQTGSNSATTNSTGSNTGTNNNNSSNTGSGTNTQQGSSTDQSNTNSTATIQSTENTSGNATTNGNSSSNSNNNSTNTANTGETGGATNNIQTIAPAPSYSETQRKGKVKEATAQLQHRGMGDYSVIGVPQSDASLLMGLTYDYLRLNGVATTSPEDPTATAILFVAVDVFGLIRTRTDLILLNQEKVTAEVAMEMYAFDQRGQLIMRPTNSNFVSSYDEKYVLWAGPIQSAKTVKEGDGLLVTFEDVTPNYKPKKTNTSQSKNFGQ